MNRLIQVFRTGTHTDSSGTERTFTAEDLRAIADRFDPEIGAVPIVKGHPATDAPAYGWVSHFMYEETTGVLFAALKDVDSGFQAEVRARRFGPISIALYSPDSPSNPIPGMWYPRHVGFLGAAAPAVKGLKAANFNDDGEGFLMFDGNDEKSMTRFAEILGNVLIKLGFKPRDDMPPGKTPKVKDSPEFKASEEARKKAEDALKAAQKATAEAQAKTARAGCASFTGDLVKAGKLTPAEAPGMTEILFSLADDTEIEFAAGEDEKKKTFKATPRKIMSDFLKGLPKRVEYNQISGHENDGLAIIGFNAPPGAQVSAERLELHQRITAYAAKHDISYVDAIPFIEQPGA